jgi:hypothetical protein
MSFSLLCPRVYFPCFAHNSGACPQGGEALPGFSAPSEQAGGRAEVGHGSDQLTIYIKRVPELAPLDVAMQNQEIDLVARTFLSS